jgi:hypothetical protein
MQDYHSYICGSCRFHLVSQQDGVAGLPAARGSARLVFHYP